MLGAQFVPFPIGVFFMLIAGSLYGAMLGTVVYVVNNTLGAWVTFSLVRPMRARVMACLGRHAQTLKRLDDAIVREGPTICLLWRVTPVFPFVISSALLSLTGITQWTFVWTTFVGEIPVSFPIISTAALGHKLLAEEQEAGSASVVVNALSVLVAVALMFRLGVVAKEVFQRSGVSTDGGDGGTDSDIDTVVLKQPTRVLV